MNRATPHRPALLAAAALSALSTISALSGCAATQPADDARTDAQAALSAADADAAPQAGAAAHALPTLALAAPAASAASAAPAAPASPAASAASAAAAASTAAADDAHQPIIIRGDDRLIAPPQKAAGVAGGALSSFRFDNAPVAEVVKVMLGDLLKADYVVHPPLAGNVTLSTHGRVPADRAMFLLEQALQANGIVVARDARGTWHVGTPQALAGIVSAPQLAQPGQRLAPGYGSVVITPQYLGAGELANILRPLAAADAVVRVDTLRNIIVMRGTRAEVEGWLDIVNTFDVNLLRGMSVGVFPLRHTSVAEADVALRLLSGGVASAATATATALPATAVQPQAGARAAGNAANQAGGRAAPAAAGAAATATALQGLGEGSPLFGALRIMPIERMNALLVITPRAAYLDEVRYWVEQFDRPNMASAEPQLFVYKVQNGAADHLSELLNGIFGTATAGSTATGATGLAPGVGSAGGATNINSSFASQFSASRNAAATGAATAATGTGFGSFGGFGNFGGFGGFGGVGAAFGGGLGNAQNRTAQAANATAATAAGTTLGSGVRVMADRINNTLLIHATPAEYARIEATLKRLDIPRAQVLIEASIVEVTLGDDLQYGLQWAFNGGIGSRTGVGLLGTAAGGAGTRVTPSGSGSFTYTLSNAAGNISAVLSALASKSLLKVISSPSLMVLDNHTAAIQVGTQEPVNTGSVINTSSNYTSTSIQYKDTGVMLGVTPSVSAGDLVTLDINQTVSSVGAASSANSGSPSFLQRQIASKVAVRSGETLVLGGLIKDESTSGKSGLPLLSSIPVIGALFGQHNTSANRTELLVIITPRVIRSDEDARAIGRELRQRMQGLSLGGAENPAAAASAPAFLNAAP